MGEFVQLFKTFIYRDLAFILGGSIVIGSVAFALRILLLPQSFNWVELPSVSYILFAVMAYVVGYAVQDVGAIVGPTFHAHPFVPNWLCRRLYTRFTRVEWTPVTYIDGFGTAVQFEVHMNRLNIPVTTLENLERILSLKVISMCVGGCSLLSSLILGLILLCSYILFGEQVINRPAIAVVMIAVILFLLGAALVSLGWLKGMQQMQFYQSIQIEGYPLKREPPSDNAGTSPFRSRPR